MIYDVQVSLGGWPGHRPTPFTSEPVPNAAEAVRVALDMVAISRAGRVRINNGDGDPLAYLARDGGKLTPVLTGFGQLDVDMSRALRAELELARQGRRGPTSAGVPISVSIGDRELAGVAADLSVVVGIVGLLGALPELPELPIRGARVRPTRTGDPSADLERLQAWLVGKDRVLPITVARFLVGRESSLRGMSQRVNQLMSELGWTRERVDGRRGGLGGGYRWRSPEASPCPS